MHTGVGRGSATCCMAAVGGDGHCHCSRVSVAGRERRCGRGGP